MPHAGKTATTGPSRLWYLFALLVFVAGFAAMGVFLFTQLSGLGDDLVQIVVPGEAELALEPGHHTIFHETRSTFEGRLYRSEGIAGLGVVLISSAGEPVALSSSARGTYEFSGRRGVAVFSFAIEEPGTYRLSASYGEGVDGPETVLAVGKAFLGGLVFTVLGAIAIVFTCAGVAVAIAMRVFVKRRRLRTVAGPSPAPTPTSRFALPASRMFVRVFLGALAGLVVLLVVGGVLENTVAPDPPRWFRNLYLAAVLSLLLAAMYSGMALMVRSVIGFQSAFWKRVGRTAGSAAVTDTVTELTPRARRVGDIFILAVWLLWALGLAIALPAMIRDGFFP